MQEFSISDIKAFSENIRELYGVFFKKYPYLKPFIFQAIMNDSGNYGLVITENENIIGKFSVIRVNDEFHLEKSISSLVNIKFQLESRLVKDILEKKSIYMRSPMKLLKYFFILSKSMSLVNQGIYAHTLEGSKVMLRVFDDSDMPYLLKWYNDYQLNKLAGWSASKVSASKLRYNMSRSFGSDPMNLMIDDLDGKPIGTIQLYDFNDQDKSCKLGIRIGDKDYWGRGYGGDAVNTIVQYAFSSLNINRVALRVYEYNERAVHCYEKCGFKHEGRSRKSAYIDGQYYDEILMGILKSDFLEI